MYKTKRLFKSVVRLLLPLALLIILAVIGISVWLVHEASHVHAAQYLIKPDKYGQLSSRAAQVTEETWPNGDGTMSRGWLLRGTQNAPGIVLLHKYGADRSYMLNLGVKLSEATNFTVLMPDLRGHGENPSIKMTSFGSREAGDATAALQFLRGLKTPEQLSLVGQDFGVYGVELGAIAALSAAANDKNVKTVVLDSAPLDSDAVLSTAVDKRFPFASSVTSKFASLGTNIYFYDGSYKMPTACEQARATNGAKVMLLAGNDAPGFQDSTSKLAKCFPAGTYPEVKTDMSPSGYTIMNASIDQAEAYDQKVIDFFKQSFGTF